MNLAISIAVSLLALRGYKYEIYEDGFSQRSSESIIWVFLFLFFSLTIIKSLHKENQKTALYSLIYAIITAFFYFIGLGIKHKQGISWIWQSRSVLLNMINSYIFYITLFYCGTFLLFLLLDNQKNKASSIHSTVFSLKSVFLFWGIMLLFYIPWHLHFYPGILTPDSDVQVRQALSIDSLSDHQPVFTTFLLKSVLVPIFYLTGSVRHGVGIVTIIQVLIVTFVFSYTYERIRMHINNRVLRFIVFLYFAIYPVHCKYSITLWKDILFSILILIITLCLDFEAENELNFFNKKNRILLFITLLLTSLFRQNGFLVVIILTLIMAIRFRSNMNYILRMGVVVFCFYMIWKNLFLPAINVEGGKSREFLSVPLQQIARTVDKHRADFYPQEIRQINEFFDIEDVWTLYDPTIADPVKDHFLSTVFDNNKVKFLTLWASIGLRYPLDYAEALLCGNYGYWFPFVKYWIVGQNIYSQEPICDLSRSTIIYFPIINDINNWMYGEYYNVPFISIFFSIGACFYFWLFCGIYSIYNNKSKFIIIFPGFIVWLSILFSPVFAEYRYVYSLFTCIPLVSASILSNNR